MSSDTLELKTLALQLCGDDVPTSMPPNARDAIWRAPPSFLTRQFERILVKSGRLRWEPSHVSALATVLPRGLPRFLIRIDEFPHYLSRDDPGTYGTAFMREVLATLADVPLLVAVVPRLAAKPLDPVGSVDIGLQPDEVEFLDELKEQHCAFGLHGLTHRTRHANPRRHSELSGLGPSQLGELLDEGLALLGEVGIEPRVVVPPFNRFGRSQYDILAERFDVVCGGPESIASMGFLPGPSWQGAAVYVPSYPPLYGSAESVAQAAQRLIDAEVPLWAPIVLHPGWERPDAFEGLRRLASVVGPHTATWAEFLAAVDDSRSVSRG